MSYRFIAAALVIATIGPATAVELNPAAVAFKLPDQIAWKAGETRASKAPSWSAIRRSPACTSC